MFARFSERLTLGVLVLALLGWMGVTQLQAAADEKGSVSGRVVGMDDKPVVGLALRLERFMPMGAGGGKGGKSTGSDSGERGLNQSPFKIIGRATTDKDGKFLMSNVEVGGGTIIGGNNKMGWVYYDVSIEANKELKLGDIKLAKTD